jgi:hypothetical protein
MSFLNIYSFYSYTFKQTKPLKIATEIRSIVMVTSWQLPCCQFLQPLVHLHGTMVYAWSMVNISMNLSIIYLLLIAVSNVLSSQLLVSFWAS